MSCIDLIVLGCVAKQPRSAYDIQKDVEEHNLSEWTRISIPSIYKKVLRLQEQDVAGHIQRRQVGPGPGVLAYRLHDTVLIFLFPGLQIVLLPL